MREQRTLPWRAISIKQPWAWLIVNGHKDIENRDWPTRMRGPIFIHAGKLYDRTCLVERFGRLVPTPQWVEWLTERGLGGVLVGLPTSFDRGGIVGMAEISDCVEESASPWFVGENGFVMKRARPLPFTGFPGQLGFFTIPGELVEGMFDWKEGADGIGAYVCDLCGSRDQRVGGIRAHIRDRLIGDAERGG